MTQFTYVYILQTISGHATPKLDKSEGEACRFYVGCTLDLAKRLKDHNQGKSAHTAKHRPWFIRTAIAFTNPKKAHAFERYLKSGSGRAFAKKRF